MDTYARGGDETAAEEGSARSAAPVEGFVCAREHCTMNAEARQFAIPLPSHKVGRIMRLLQLMLGALRAAAV